MEFGNLQIRASVEEPNRLIGNTAQRQNASYARWIYDSCLNKGGLHWIFAIAQSRDVFLGAARRNQLYGDAFFGKVVDVFFSQHLIGTALRAGCHQNPLGRGRIG